ncbi:hypothetical protein D3C77_308080 [compost metagenome]
MYCLSKGIHCLLQGLVTGRLTTVHCVGNAQIAQDFGARSSFPLITLAAVQQFTHLNDKWQELVGLVSIVSVGEFDIPAGNYESEHLGKILPK